MLPKALGSLLHNKVGSHPSFLQTGTTNPLVLEVSFTTAFGCTVGICLLTASDEADKVGGRMRKLMIPLMGMVVALVVFAIPQRASTSPTTTAVQTAPKEDRVSGTIVRINKDKSTLTVQENTSKIERTVFYNESTKWTKGKGVATDMKEFKDGSRVICLGKLNEKGELTATRIDLQ
jgi:hypothetical protein